MEKEGLGNNTSKTQQFAQVIKKAQSGDKQSMEKVLSYFTEDINYLSRFIMLPKEEAIQELRMELINIICKKI